MKLITKTKHYWKSVLRIDFRSKAEHKQISFGIIKRFSQNRFFFVFYDGVIQLYVVEEHDSIENSLM